MPRLTTPKRLVADQQLMRDVQRTIAERQALAALTPEVLAGLAAITEEDVRVAQRAWERANSGTDVERILRAEAL